MNKTNQILLNFIVLIILIQPVIAETQDTTSTASDTLILQKSPTEAVLRSLALPGWGQYYVESYWKAPLFFAAWGTVVFFIVDNHIKYTDAANEYDNYTGTNPAEKNFLFRKKEYFRDYRDLNILYLLGIYIISSIDAYVGANMYGFNVDDKIAISYNLNNLGNLEIKFTYKIKR